jgi:hypothetical protein
MILLSTKVTGNNPASKMNNDIQFLLPDAKYYKAKGQVQTFYKFKIIYELYQTQRYHELFRILQWYFLLSNFD